MIASKNRISNSSGILPFFYAASFPKLNLALVAVLSVTAPFCVYSQEASGEDELRVEHLEDLAEVYVDRYFEPDEKYELSEGGQNKASALAHYSIGRMLENSGQPEAAVASYQQVLEIRPQELMLARKTANLLARTGQVEKARSLLEKAEKLNPRNPRAPIVLSEFLYTYFSDAKEDRDLSLNIAKDAVEKFPDSSEAYENLVRRYLLEGKREDARAVMDKASQRPSKNPQFWLRMGALAKRTWPTRTTGTQEPVVVNKLFEKALDNANGNLNIVEAVGDYYARSNQAGRAREILEGIVEKHPDRLNVRRKLVAIYEAQGDDTKMIEAMKGIVEIDSSDTQMCRRLAEFHFNRVLEKERNDEVLKADDPDIVGTAVYYRKALQTGKGPAHEYLRAGQFFTWAKKYDEAIAILESGAYLYPDEPSFLSAAAETMTRDDRWEDAIRKYGELEKLAEVENPKLLDKEFYFDVGVAYERVGNIDKASENLKKSIELIARDDPNDSGDRERQDRFTARVYNYLGYTWVENDRHIDEGGKLIETALQLEPENGAYVDSIGWFYFKKQKYQQALESLLRAQELMDKERKELEEKGYDLNPVDGVVFDHIGQAYWMTGNKEKAVEYLEKAVHHEVERKSEFEKRLKTYRETEPPAPAPAGENERTGNLKPEKPASESGKQAPDAPKESREGEKDAA